MAYRDVAGGVSLATGAPIPLWQDMDPKIRDAWDFAADQVRLMVLDQVAEVAAELKVNATGAGQPRALKVAEMPPHSLLTGAETQTLTASELSILTGQDFRHRD